MSQIQNHTRIALVARHSDAKQDMLSNESQLREMQEWYTREVPHGEVVRVFSGQYSAYRNPAKGMGKIYESVKQYNKNSSRPITLVLWHSPTRFIRRLLGGAEWFQKFRNIGVEVNTKTRWYDFDDTVQLGMFMLELMQGQKESENTGAHIKRNCKERLRQGYYPRARNRFMGKKTVDGHKIEYWLDSIDHLRNAGIAIGLGMGAHAAYNQFGGREVFGCKQSFMNYLRNEVFMGRYQGYDLKLKAIWTESEYQALQKAINNKPLTSKQKSLAAYFCRGSLRSPITWELLSSETARSRNGGKHHYYSRRVNGATEVRFKRGQVHSVVMSALQQIGAAAERQKELSKAAEQRAKKTRAEIERRIKSTRKELESAEQAKGNALRLFVSGQISQQERAIIDSDYDKIVGQLEKDQAMLSRHGEILAHVKESIKNLGVVTAKHANGLILNSFLAMLFPDGFTICPETRILQTSSLNSSFSLLGTESDSYDRIKFGVPDFGSETPSKWSFVVDKRTSRSDLELFWSYQDLIQKVG